MVLLRCGLCMIVSVIDAWRLRRLRARAERVLAARERITPEQLARTVKTLTALVEGGNSSRPEQDRRLIDTLRHLQQA